MSTDADNKFWKEHAAKLREFAKLRPLTPEEAEKAARDAPEVPLTPDEIQKLVDAGANCPPDDVPEYDWLKEEDTESVEDDVLQLNRNKGDGDEETDAAEEELRRRMLDDEEDEGGMEDGAGPPRRGGPVG